MDWVKSVGLGRASWEVMCWAGRAMCVCVVLCGGVRSAFQSP